MYLHVNDFDYDGLIARLVEMYGLEDTPVSSDFIEKAFTELSLKFKKHKRSELTPEEITLVEAFLRFNMGWEAFQEGDTAEGFWESRAEAIQDSLSGLYECLVDPESVIPDELEYIIQSLSVMTDTDVHTEEGAIELTTTIEDLIERYTPVDFNETELWIIGQMSGNIMFSRGIRDITVIPVPGKIVKCMDTLITFPIILIEVLNNE